jgi:hypothetical protein
VVRLLRKWIATFDSQQRDLAVLRITPSSVLRNGGPLTHRELQQRRLEIRRSIDAGGGLPRV